MSMLRRPSSVPLLGALLVIAASACLDIDYTPPPAGSGGGGNGGSTGGAGNDGGSSYTPPPCIENCANKTPAGAVDFLAVAACNEAAVAGPCAEACAPGAPDSAYGPSDCGVPGQVDPSVPCNSCIKHECCAELTRCFSDTACLTVGICASGCR